MRDFFVTLDNCLLFVYDITINTKRDPKSVSALGALFFLSYMILKILEVIEVL